MTHPFRRCVLVILIFTLARYGAVARADLTIADLAPRDSIALLGIDDYPALRSAFMKTGINDLLREPEMRHWLVGVLGKVGFQFGDLLDDKWLRDRAFPQPEGMVGVAAWADPKTASPVIEHYLLAAQMGDEADDFHELIDSTLARATKNNHVRVTEIDVAEDGVVIRRVELLDFEEGEFGDVMMRTPFELYLAQRDDLFLFCSDKNELGKALERAAGADLPAANDREEIAQSLAPIEPVHVHLTVLVDRLIDLVEQLQRSDIGKKVTDGVESPIRPVLKAMGFASVQAISYGWQFDAPHAMLESRGMVLAPNREGVLGLFDNAVDGFAPPAFVESDAAQVRIVRGEFTKLLPLANTILGALSDNERVQLQALADLVTAVAGPIVSTLGPEAMFVRTIPRPFTDDSEDALYAVQLHNQRSLTTTLSQYGRLLGVKNRSRDGDLVWETSGGDAIGVGNDHMLLGSKEMVRQSLHRASIADGQRLADTSRFKRAIASHAPGGFYYAYVNLSTVLEYKHWKSENWEQLLREKFHALDLTDAQIDDYVDQRKTARSRRLFDSLPPPEVFLPHVGDFVDEARVVPNGLFYHGFWLASEPPNADRGALSKE